MRQLPNLFLWSFLLLVSLFSYSQGNNHQSIRIAPSQIETAVNLNDHIKQVEVLNIGHPSIEKGKTIYLLSMGEQMYLTVLGGKTILKLNKDGQIIQEFQSKNSTPINFIFSIWSSDGHIFVYDSTLATIFKFNSSGKLLKQTKIDVTNASSIIGHENVTWLDMTRINIYGSKEPTKHNLLAYDQGMGFKGYRIPYNFNLPANTGSGITNFSLHDGYLYYKQPHSTSVYELKADSAKSIITFEFGQAWPYDLHEEKGTLSLEELLEIMKNPDLISYHKSWASSNHVFSEFKMGNTIYYHLLNRSNNRQKVFSAPKLNSRIQVVNWFDNRLAVIVPHDEKNQLIKYLAPSGLIEKSRKNELDQYTHSILFIEFNRLD